MWVERKSAIDVFNSARVIVGYDRLSRVPVSQRDFAWYERVLSLFELASELGLDGMAELAEQLMTEFVSQVSRRSVLAPLGDPTGLAVAQ